ncbi:rhodanese-like domain-containing protein [Streptomyces sp. NRRL B-24484]|uniref:rhodanese-like domain-containing protein n=1 Tax=Streptomyces sp. NRRL B-24484 TaxID=1463833 RepID=UPI000998B6D5|nr:rhodanese-like domain-containing protein [Streptomyces sp. NRRL B-24484]
MSTWSTWSAWSTWSSGSPGSTQSPRTTVPGRLAPTEAYRLTATGAAVLLDVREAAERLDERPPGSLHLPLSALESGGGLPAEAAGRPVVVVCRSGRRSLRAVELLAHRGVSAVDVVGGLLAWAEAGLPLTGGPGADGDGCPGGAA